MKIRYIREEPADCLPQWLQRSQEESGFEVDDFCCRIGIDPFNWGLFLKGVLPVFDGGTLARIEKLTGMKYDAEAERKRYQPK